MGASDDFTNAKLRLVSEIRDLVSLLTLAESRRFYRQLSLPILCMPRGIGPHGKATGRPAPGKRRHNETFD
jgi:hypothetical protein